jgi:hypothetical protein
MFTPTKTKEAVKRKPDSLTKLAVKAGPVFFFIPPTQSMEDAATVAKLPPLWFLLAIL